LRRLEDVGHGLLVALQSQLRLGIGVHGLVLVLNSHDVVEGRVVALDAVRGLHGPRLGHAPETPGPAPGLGDAMPHFFAEFVDHPHDGNLMLVELRGGEDH